MTLTVPAQNRFVSPTHKKNVARVFDQILLQSEMFHLINYKNNDIYSIIKTNFCMVKKIVNRA
jgi:hypothetical protein